MPELPEVESIRLQLERFIVGNIISSIEIKNPKYEISNKKEIIGAKVTGIRRWGKVLSIDLSNDYSILIHVKLSGQLIYKGLKLKAGTISKKVIGGVPGSHTHLIFNLGKDGKLFYNDVRRFGWIKVIKTSQLLTDSFVGRLGLEPLKDLTIKKFGNVLSKTKRNIKVLLMDQSKISGVGNIYANDALWDAGIDPKRPANSLSQKEQDVLLKSIEKVLKEGIKRGGASELSFVTPDGLEGNYQDFTLVYGREGKKCKKCGAEIKKYFLGGRGTYICSRCQV